MKTSAKKKAYDMEYSATHTRQIKFSFSLQYDADILAQLDAVPNKQGYIKELIRADIAAHGPAQKEGKTMKISFEAGEGRNFQGAVNYMKSKDGTVYAEVAVPDGASDDYGYLTMKQAILKQYTGKDTLSFWYDGQEQNLEPDASADAKVYLEIE